MVAFEAHWEEIHDSLMPVRVVAPDPGTSEVDPALNLPDDNLQPQWALGSVLGYRAGD